MPIFYVQNFKKSINFYIFYIFFKKFKGKICEMLSYRSFKKNNLKRSLYVVFFKKNGFFIGFFTFSLQ